MAEAKIVTLPVTGMTCANCAATIERQVRKLPGINVANVNLASEKLSVTFDPALVDELGIIARVVRAGYGVATGRAELPVKGLRDNSDALSLEKLLQKQNGVLKAAVGYGTERATLEYIPGVTSIGELAGVIRKAGFDLVQVNENETVEDVEARVRAGEVRRQKRLLILGLILTVPLVAYSMSRDFGLVYHYLDRYGMMALATVVQFVVGWQYYVGAFKSLRSGGANMDVLIALGSSVAYFYSVGVTIGLIPRESVYFETGAAIITLIMLGKFLEARARGRTGEALKALMGLRPRNALVIRAGVEQEISIEQVLVGDTIVVRPGEKVPVDGIILEGRSAFDESMITGESLPVNRGPGEEIIGATINRHGLVKFEATRVGKNTTLAQIVRLVQEAQASKAPIQRLTDRISTFFVPMVVGIALLTFLGWLLIARADWTGAMINAVAVVVIACPCALGLATPTAIMVGTTRGAENGLLFKNSESLERAGHIDIVVLDKTGTITTGKPAVTDVFPTGGRSPEDLLRLAASAERGSEHPLGSAIVAAAQERRLALAEPEQFAAVSGFGIRATVAGQAVLIGNPRLMQNEGIAIAELEETISRLQGEGKTAMIVATAANGAAAPGGDSPGFPAGVIAVSDTVKPGSREAIADLRRLGLGVVMITGDNARTAQSIARQVGIEQVLAEVPPGGKVAEVKRLQEMPAGGRPAGAPASASWTKAARRVVAMVGDGINDAPALAQADVGIAIGSGTDVAMAAAGITLIGGDLRGVARAISLSRGTVKTIVQNLFWAFFYNVLLIPIAALGFLVPMVAAGAMAFSSIFVVTNSLRLRGYKLQNLSPRTSLAYQLADLAPRLVLSGAVLGLLIAFSIGLFNPIAGSKMAMGGRPTTYKLALAASQIDTPQDIVLGMDILDNFGKKVRSFENRYAYVAVVKRDLSSVDLYSTLPDSPSISSSGGMDMGSRPGPTPTPRAGAQGILTPELSFSSAGQYVVFVKFWPRMSSPATISAPFNVGAASMAPAALLPDPSLTRRVGDVNVTLTSSSALLAGRPLYLTFTVTDAPGRDISDAVQVLSNNQYMLKIVDEKLTTFLLPEFVNRHKLQYGVTFPRTGVYKMWFQFRNPTQDNEVTFIVKVR